MRFFRKKFSGQWVPKLQEWVGHWWPDLAGSEDCGAAWLRMLELPVQCEGSTHWLWPLEWPMRARAWMRGEMVEHEHPMIFPDDRAFLWSSVVVKEGATILDEKTPEQTAGWLALLNADNPPESWVKKLDHAFSVQFVERNSYLRWSPGSLYGFTPHSGVALLPVWSDPPLHEVFQRLYLQQCILLLYLRTALFSFSREISRLSRKVQKETMRRDTARDFRRLELQFSLFTNLYQFPLLSHQQQGVEMYALQRRCLDIDDFYKEIQSEIRHMDEVLDRRHDRSIRALGIGIAVVATTGVVWDDLGLKDGLSAGGILGLGMLALVVWGLVWCGLRQLDRD